MLHYYLQRGLPPEHILSLPSLDRNFYFASMQIAIEEERAKYEALIGR